MSLSKNSYIGSILLDFPVLPKYFDASQDLEGRISDILEKRFGKFCKLFSGLVQPNKATLGRIALLSGEKGVTVNIRTYPTRSAVTVNVDYDLETYSGIPPLSFEEITDLEVELAREFESVKKTSPMPQVKRILDFDIYFPTMDSRLLEYDIQEMLFDAQSDYQHVQIAKSVGYGNVLILDGLINMAESDLCYTEAIMHRGETSYTGKDILILGSGDGALLTELRKEDAKSITMVEIDEVVMSACKAHLRLACGNTLDNYKCENYEIIVGDCISFMETCKKEEKKFDFIFGDLTDVPISSASQQGEIFDFFQKTLQLSFDILIENGVYYTHSGITDGDGDGLMYKRTIQDSLAFPVQINQSTAFVPSFQEKWAFYEVKKMS